VLGGGILTGIALLSWPTSSHRLSAANIRGYLGAVFVLAGTYSGRGRGYLTDNVGWRWVSLRELPIGLVIDRVLLTFPIGAVPCAHRSAVDYLGAGGNLRYGVRALVMAALIWPHALGDYFGVWPCSGGGAPLSLLRVARVGEF